jgi:molecular chaperone GrpE
MRRGYRLGDQVLRHALVGVVDTVDDEPLARRATGEEADADAEDTAESEESAS